MDREIQPKVINPCCDSVLHLGLAEYNTWGNSALPRKVFSVSCEESSLELALEEFRSGAELGRGADIHHGTLSHVFESSSQSNMPQL